MRGNCSDQPRGGIARGGAEMLSDGLAQKRVAKRCYGKGVERTARLSTVQQSKGSA